MKCCIWMLVALLAWGLGELRTAVAQTYYNGGLSYQGMFGYRTLGQPLAPQPGIFGGGIQTAPSGAFLYIGRDGSVGGFATPWRQIDPLVLQQSISPPPGGRPVVEVPALLEGVPGAPLPPGTSWQLPTLVQPAGAGVVEAVRPINEVGANNPSAASNANPMGQPGSASPMGQPGNAAPTAQATNATSAGQAAGAAAPVGPPPTPIVALSTATPAATSAPALSFALSPRLSEMLTQIARDRNLLAGRGINVYVSGHVAVLQGAVRSADDRGLLANIVSLEPNISQIENRLTVQRPAATGPGTSPAQSAR